MSSEDDKQFQCDASGCEMRFTDEHDLSYHRKRHELCLTLPNSSIAPRSFVDQTPTPTRFLGHFLKNYEEVGLSNLIALEEVQSASNTPVVNLPNNPFAETFKKAASNDPTIQNGLNVSVLNSEESLNTPSIHIERDTHTHHKKTYSKRPQSGTSNEQVHEETSSDFSGLSSDGNGDDEAESNTSIRSLMKDKKSLAVPVICKAKNHLLPKSCETAGFFKQIVQKPAIKNSSATVPNNPKPIAVLPKPPATVITQAPIYQVFLKLPDGGSVHIPVVPFAASTNTQPVSAPKQLFANDENVKLTTKLVQNHASSLTIGQNGINSAPSTSSSVNTEIDSDSSSLPRGKPGRRSKFAPEEDPVEKKIRSLERNRAAAMRCRKKRKVWVEALEEKAQELEDINDKLQSEVASLRREVTMLKTAFLAHKDCPITLQQLKVVGQAKDKILDKDCMHSSDLPIKPFTLSNIISDNERITAAESIDEGVSET